mmetsp:Transcript_127446/g.318206  ORF Transcript_127446/g.318206 Transcript_127446/m.318206 type:complete len:240 (+) Transcript_127446:318-1037(+)
MPSAYEGDELSLAAQLREADTHAGRNDLLRDVLVDLHPLQPRRPFPDRPAAVHHLAHLVAGKLPIVGIDVRHSFLVGRPLLQAPAALRLESLLQPPIADVRGATDVQGVMLEQGTPNGQPHFVRARASVARHTFRHVRGHPAVEAVAVVVVVAAGVSLLPFSVGALPTAPAPLAAGRESVVPLGEAVSVRGVFPVDLLALLLLECHRVVLLLLLVAVPTWGPCHIGQVGQVLSWNPELV